MTKENIRFIKRIVSVLMTVVLALNISSFTYAKEAIQDPYYIIADEENASKALLDMIKNRKITAAVYLVDDHTVRKKADTYSAAVAKVDSGQSVTVAGVETDKNNNIWYKINFTDNGISKEGFIEFEFVASSDDRLLKWEKKYITTVDREEVRKLGDCSDIELFPEEYQDKLYELKKIHPNWVFVRQNIGIDWSTVLYQENLNERSLISSSADSSFKKKPSVGTAGWYVPTDEILAYYLDPRNFLSEDKVFMFEQETFSDTAHTVGAIEKVLTGTFMDGYVEDSDKTYAQTFYDIGREINVSPISLASRVKQEQGVNGTSPLISGTYKGYEGYYNYFNFKANGSTNEQIYKNGLAYAKEKGWDTRTKSLKGGAQLIGKNYILRGQDTAYLQKFDVDDSDNTLYTHQYMQNIAAPYSESSSTYKAYKNASLLDNSFVFKIPVYQSMPAGICIKPNEKDKVSLNRDEITNLPVDRSAVIVALINGGQTKRSDMSYTSSDESIVTVDENGVVTGKYPGSATISVKRRSGDTNTANCKVNVIKADIAESDIPQLEMEIMYFEDQKLSDIALPDGFSWEDENLVPSADNNGYNVIYRTDTSRYNAMTVLAKLDVNATLLSSDEPVLPTDLKGYAQDDLDSIILPEGFVWKDRCQVLPDEPGVYDIEALYCEDPEKFETVSTVLSVEVTEPEITKTEDLEGPGDIGDDTGDAGTGDIDTSSDKNDGNMKIIDISSPEKTKEVLENENELKTQITDPKPDDKTDSEADKPGEKTTVNKDSDKKPAMAAAKDSEEENVPATKSEIVSEKEKKADPVKAETAEIEDSIPLQAAEDTDIDNGSNNGVLNVMLPILLVTVIIFIASLVFLIIRKRNTAGSDKEGD